VHEFENRAVSTETLFPCLSLGQSVAQIVLLSLFTPEALSTPVCKVWPAFGNSRVTVAEVLSGGHLPFPSSAVPEKFFIASMHRWKDHVAFVATLAGRDDLQPPFPALPWELSAQSYAWGWAVMGLVQHLNTSKGDECALEVLVSEMATKLGAVLAARAPESELPLPASKKGTLAEEEEAAREAKRERVDAKYARLCVDVEKLSGGAVDLDKMINEQQEQPPAIEGFDLSSVLKALDPSLKGKEYFIDPRVMNCPSARCSASPSCNLLATATSLARLWFALGNGQGMWQQARVVPESVAEYFNAFLTTAPPTAELEPLGERLGMKVFEFKHRSRGELIKGFGQVAFGGSLVVSIPQIEVSFAVLVNDLTLDREVSRLVVEEIAQFFDLQVLSEI
jgi:hypothetical protein